MSTGHLVRLTIDGSAHEVRVDGCESLLTVLRDRLGVMVAKDGCHHGACGACAVWLDDDVVCSCVVPVIQVDGGCVRTVAGAAHDVQGVQEALVQGGAVQCGFCTPGIVVVAADLLRRKAEPTDADLLEALEGNLCRCTGYTKIIDALLAAMADRRG